MIGLNVWIGNGVMITAGVTLGTGAVIGAGAVAAIDLAPHIVASGVPARETKRRFTGAQADALQEIAVWDWPREKYKPALPEIRALEVNAFIEKYR
ncbi:MAG: hypothetical protein AAGK37_23035 [Pseudomonadota bacterium]